MNLLAFETATDVCGVALMLENEVVTLNEGNIPRQHAQRLPALYQSIVDEYNINLSVLDGIAVSIGPGSFTGLRIGLSYSKGLAYSHGLPIVPVPTLQGIAEGCDSDNDFRVLLFSHRDLIYHQKFNQGKSPITKASITRWDDLKNNLDQSNIFQINCEKFFDGQVVTASAKHIVKCARDHYEEWAQSDPFKLVPNYIAQFEINK